MKRRDFITLLGGAAATWPLAARAQQPERMRRIGVLTNLASDDSAQQSRVLAFAQALAQSGWTEGRNVRIDIRWGASDPERVRRYVAETVALAPDVILAVGSAATGGCCSRRALCRSCSCWSPTRWALASSKPSLGRGGNATGFMLYEFDFGGKWLELLKEIAPGVKRVAFLRNPAIAAGAGQFAAIQASAPSLGVEVRPINVRDAGEIERAITAFAQPSNGGLIVAAGAAAFFHRDVIIKLAARHRLPALYSDHAFVTDGGLIAYGPDRVDQFRRAADYVDRILKGEKPADLPVQAPTKYDLTINLKTAKALGLTVPPSLLARADEVIE